MKDIGKFFIGDNNIFDHDEISQSDKKFFANFYCWYKKVYWKYEAAKMEIVDSIIKQKTQIKEQISTDNDEKQHEIENESHLMKK